MNFSAGRQKAGTAVPEVRIPMSTWPKITSRQAYPLSTSANRSLAIKLLLSIEFMIGLFYHISRFMSI